jgi:predicted amidophosphoribosyltransferase
MISEHQCDVVVRKEPWYSAGYLPETIIVCQVFIATSARTDQGREGKRDDLAEAFSFDVRKLRLLLDDCIDTGSTMR